MSLSTIQCTTCGDSVEDGALFCPHCGDAIHYQPPEVDPFIGRMVSQRYTVVQRIARGGMGEVYLARHAELNQRVAVKFLHRRFADDEEFATRFFNEARSACRVSHPNAVSIYDFGRLEDGTLYIVMEFVEGIPLKAMIARDGRLGVKTTLRIAQQAAEVLSAAHRQSIVHRDVKPDNIMIMESPSGRASIKMLDFGIAKILDDESSAAALTQTGVTFGTPEYMSPEQAAGREVDVRSDVYSLGLCIYTMLVGHPPFRGKNKLALLQRHIREAPPALDRAAPMPLPPELVQLVAEALDKDPGRRPQTMDELATRIEEIERNTLGASSSSAGGVALGGSATKFAGSAVGASDGAVDSRPASSSGGGRVLTHGRSESRDPDFGLGSTLEPTETYQLGEGPVALDEFTLGTGRSTSQSDSYSLGDRGERDEYAFDDDPYAAPLNRTQKHKVQRSSRGPFVLFAIVLVVGTLALANTFMNRRGGELLAAAGSGEGSAEGSGGAEGETDGSGIAEGSGAALAIEGSGAAPVPPPVQRDEVGEGVSAALAAIEEGDVERADSLLDTLEAQGAGGFQAVENARNRLTAVEGLVTQIRRELRAGNCLLADEKVVELQERYTRRLAMTFWGGLDECRAAQRNASRSDSAASNSGAANSGAAAAPEPDAGTPASAPAPTPEPSTQDTGSRGGSTSGSTPRRTPPREL